MFESSCKDITNGFVEGPVLVNWQTDTVCMIIPMKENHHISMVRLIHSWEDSQSSGCSGCRNPQSSEMTLSKDTVLRVALPPEKCTAQAKPKDYYYDMSIFKRWFERKKNKKSTKITG